MKKIYLLFTVFYLSLSFALAHQGSVEGKVITVYGNNAIVKATVKLKDTEYKTETDSAGNFTFNNIIARNYTIEISKEDFHTFTQAIDVKENKTQRINATLFPYLVTLKGAEINAAQQMTTASSQLISSSDFSLRPRNSAQDLLRLVPGLFIAQHAGGGKSDQIFIRGFDCDHGTDVASYVDGVPVNMPSHGHGQGYADAHFIIPEAVANLEVNKGPYNAQYGDFATGAAIQFNTADTLTSSFVKTEFTSTPTQRNLSGTRYVMGLNLPDKSEKTSSYIVSEYVNNAGYFNLSQNYKRFNLFGKFKTYINNSTSITFSASGFQSSWDASGQIPERAVASKLISRYGSIDPTEGGTTQRQNINLQLSQRIDNRQLDANFFYSNYGFKLFSNFTFFAKDSIRGDEIEQTDNRNIIGINVKYKILYNTGNIHTKTTFGTSIRVDNIENELLHDSARVRLSYVRHSKIAQQSSALFVKQEFTLTSWLRTEFALRYDYFVFDVRDQLPLASTTALNSGVNYQSLVSPKLNIIIMPFKNAQIFINAGQGFHSNDARSSVMDNTNHMLPKAIGAEIGGQYTINNRVIVNVTYWQLFNQAELVYIGDEGTTENNGTSKRSGIDATMRAQLFKWLYVDCDFNTSQSVLTQDFWGKYLEQEKYVPLAPTLTSTGGVTYKIKNFSSSMRYRYLGNRPANEANTVTAHGYNVIDFGLSYQLKKHKFEFGIENVLNTKWNEAQFDTESRLKTETQSVSELHYTPGTPFAVKVGYTFMF
ncbi:MAG: TonB-dependent receptor plug domain-containing protein [Bacteroidia bacterium]|nr:TonB-dependent receptor plug domain-containing protein [Bacteroidia bacterium]